MQAEATENDPYARAYLAQPNQYTILDDAPTGPPTPPLSPYRVLQDDSVVVPDMAGDGTMDYDSDDYNPQVFHSPRNRAPCTNPDWDIPISDHVLSYMTIVTWQK